MKVLNIPSGAVPLSTLRVHSTKLLSTVDVTVSISLICPSLQPRLPIRFYAKGNNGMNATQCRAMVPLKTLVAFLTRDAFRPMSKAQLGGSSYRRFVSPAHRASAKLLRVLFFDGSHPIEGLTISQTIHELLKGFLEVREESVVRQRFLVFLVLCVIPKRVRRNVGDRGACTVLLIHFSTDR